MAALVVEVRYVTVPDLDVILPSLQDLERKVRQAAGLDVHPGGGLIGVLAVELIEEKAKRDNEAAAKLTEAQLAKQIQETTATKDAEIQSLKAILEASEVAQKLAVSQAVDVVEKERGSTDDAFTGSSYTSSAESVMLSSYT